MIEQFAQWAGLDLADATLAGHLTRWTLHPGFINGEQACIAIMSGSEIHFAVAPEWRRRLILRAHLKRKGLAGDPVKPFESLAE